MDNEVTSISCFKNGVHLGYELLTKLGIDKKWEHISPKEVYKPYNGGFGGYGISAGAGMSNQFMNKYTNKWDTFHDYEDFYEESTIGKRESRKNGEKIDVWHYCEHISITEMDEVYIQDTLSTGCCPICNSNDLVELPEGEKVCQDCESFWNIPDTKGLMEVDDEYQEWVDEMYYREKMKEIREERKIDTTKELQ